MARVGGWSCGWWWWWWCGEIDVGFVATTAVATAAAAVVVTCWFWIFAAAAAAAAVVLVLFAFLLPIFVLLFLFLKFLVKEEAGNTGNATLSLSLPHSLVTLSPTLTLL